MTQIRAYMLARLFRRGEPLSVEASKAGIFRIIELKGGKVLLRGAGQGISRGVKRLPVPEALSMRSTRNVRQSRRDVSHEGRYQIRPAVTSRCGSIVRLVTLPSRSRYRMVTSSC